MRERIVSTSLTHLARGREPSEPDGRALLVEQRRTLLGGNGCREVTLEVSARQFRKLHRKNGPPGWKVMLVAMMEEEKKIEGGGSVE